MNVGVMCERVSFTIQCTATQASDVRRKAYNLPVVTAFLRT